jgi:hypothetical protein
MKHFIFLLLFSASLFAQEYAHPVILDPMIGDTVDAVEREWYQLLPAMPGFEKAVYYLNTDSSVWARVFLKRDLLRSDTAVGLHSSLAFMRRQIAQMLSVRSGHPTSDTELREDALFGSGEGRSILVRLMNDSVIEGELISVRPDGFVINTGVSGDARFCSKNTLAVIKGSEIRSMELAGMPTIPAIAAGILGAAAGSILGIYAGYNIGYSIDERWKNTREAPSAGIGIVVGFIAGGITGFIVPWLLINHGTEYEREDFHRVPDLRLEARYREKEPACLREKK